MIKLIDNLLTQQILAGKSPPAGGEERMLRFIKQIEVNLIICPKETEGAGNRSKMGGGLLWHWVGMLAGAM